MNFDEKVRGMTPKEIVMSMVNGLRKRHVCVNMHFFGGFACGVCIGCAATNTLCEIGQVVFDLDSIGDTDARAKFINGSRYFVDIFENAINDLRMGDVRACNDWLTRIGLSLLKDTAELNLEILPCLNNDFTEEELERYIQFANSQD